MLHGAFDTTNEIELFVRNSAFYNVSVGPICVHKIYTDHNVSVGPICVHKIYTDQNSVETNHLCQPLDQFIIREIKRFWRKAWDMKRLEMTQNNEFSTQSGKLNHRHWYMNLAKDCVEAVNGMVDKNGLRLVRKAMIKCGLSCDLDGVWRIEQLSHELQDICNAYPENFNGAVPADNQE